MTEVANNYGTMKRAWEWADKKGLITFTWHWFSPLGGRSKSFFDYELNNHYNVYESYFYRGVTMGEHYLTVNMIKMAYYGGIRDAIIPMPITFDLDTGEPVTLPEILNCSEEQIEELVADCIYDYFLSQGDEYFSWKGRDTYLCYEPQDFYMLEQGLGVYYPRYAIDCGAAGDFLFVIPYEELYGKVPEDASFSP